MSGASAAWSVCSSASITRALRASHRSEPHGNLPPALHHLDSYALCPFALLPPDNPRRRSPKIPSLDHRNSPAGERRVGLRRPIAGPPERERRPVAGVEEAPPAVDR